MASIRLARQIHAAVLELRVREVEVPEELIEVAGNLFSVHPMAEDVVGGAEASTDRLVNIQHMSPFVPRVRVEGEIAAVLDAVRVVLEVVGTMFGPSTDHARAARASLEPDNQRVIFLVIPGLGQEEIQVVQALGVYGHVVTHKGIVAEDYPVLCVPHFFFATDFFFPFGLFGLILKDVGDLFAEE